MLYIVCYELIECNHLREAPFAPRNKVRFYYHYYYHYYYFHRSTLPLLTPPAIAPNSRDYRH